MKKQMVIMAVVAPLLALNLAAQQAPPAAAASLAQRIVHTNPASFRPSKGVHGGAGDMHFLGKRAHRQPGVATELGDDAPVDGVDLVFAGVRHALSVPAQGARPADGSRR